MRQKATSSAIIMHTKWADITENICRCQTISLRRKLATKSTSLFSQIDSQLTCNDEEEREEMAQRRHEDEAYWISLEPEDGQLSGQ